MQRLANCFTSSLGPIGLLQERLKDALKNSAERGTLLASVLQDYLESVAKPCLELRLLPVPA